MKEIDGVSVLALGSGIRCDYQLGKVVKFKWR
jgi:hypothetical protein